MSDTNPLAQWMIQHGFATGHGDSLEDLLNELSWQIAEMRMEAGKNKRLITELADALADVLPMKQYAASFKLPYYDLVTRARGRERRAD